MQLRRPHEQSLRAKPRPADRSIKLKVIQAVGRDGPSARENEEPIKEMKPKGQSDESIAVSVRGEVMSRSAEQVPQPTATT